MKMKSLIAPKWVNAGENTKLVCDYDLGRDVMYSIKWFKDGHEDEHEVYRYIPTNQPVQYKSFKTPGVLVDVSLAAHAWFIRSRLGTNLKILILELSEP